jgi:hypothetical protein
LPRFNTGEKSWIYGYDPETKQQSSHWKSPKLPRPKKERQVASRGLFTKDSSWQVKQSILHTNVTFYNDFMKMYEHFSPNCGNKGIGCHITTTHHPTLPFQAGNFLQNTR